MIKRALNSLRFMREHRWTSTHLSEYIDRELSEPDSERVEEHVRLCPQCHRILGTLRRTVGGLRSLRDRPPARPPAGGTAEGVLGRIRDEG
jgi:anti-sigma factor RsiW